MDEPTGTYSRDRKRRREGGRRRRRPLEIECRSEHGRSQSPQAPPIQISSNCDLASRPKGSSGTSCRPAAGRLPAGKCCMHNPLRAALPPLAGPDREPCGVSRGPAGYSSRSARHWHWDRDRGTGRRLVEWAGNDNVRADTIGAPGMGHLDCSLAAKRVGGGGDGVAGALADVVEFGLVQCSVGRGLKMAAAVRERERKVAKFRRPLVELLRQPGAQFPAGPVAWRTNSHLNKSPGASPCPDGSGASEPRGLAATSASGCGSGRGGSSRWPTGRLAASGRGRLRGLGRAAGRRWARGQERLGRAGP